VVILALPKVSRRAAGGPRPPANGHAPKARFAVTMTAVCPESLRIRWREAEEVTVRWTVAPPSALPAGLGKGEIAQFVRNRRGSGHDPGDHFPEEGS
jgi:hypothetical protein